MFECLLDENDKRRGEVKAFLAGLDDRQKGEMAKMNR